ncbi:arylformamidase [Limnohabitans sp.]|uniref:arylformamidase n=1 Tax=Limnohabitans sp. TaxID=1907725 RepID=UPI0037C187E2
MKQLSDPLWDISPPVDAHSPVFPGDTPYTQQWAATLSDSCPVNVSAITLSPHVGAHADAPLHYDPQGAAVGALALLPFLGHCRVIHALNAGPLITLAHLQHALADLPPRVLVRTYRAFPLAQFDTQLTGFDPGCVQHLADLGVLLIGTDSASIDPAGSKLLPSHQVIRQRGLRVLENLLLDDVPEGDYELIALPLKLMSADASPVRAVLREL